MRAGSLAAFALGLVLVGGCNALKAPTPPPFEVQLRVHGDPDEPLAGTEISYRQQKVGTSNADGLVKLKMRGSEGETRELSVRCPSGHQSPDKPLAVALRRTAEPGARAEYRVECPRTSRNVVVAVRAEAGGNLPVLYLGKEVARTDVSGAAHVSLDVPPNQAFQLQISTDGAKDLRPQNPVATFEVKRQDSVFLFDQKFKLEKKPVPFVAKKRDEGPTEIRGSSDGPTPLG